MNELSVKVIATHHHTESRTDNDMVLVAEVMDANGEPVTDLDVDNFEVWQLGIVSFGKLNPTRVQHLGDVDEDLNGVYHVVRQWSIFAEAQICFCVVVTRLADGDQARPEKGRAMAALVTQGAED